MGVWTSHLGYFVALRKQTKKQKKIKMKYGFLGEIEMKFPDVA